MASLTFYEHAYRTVIPCPEDRIPITPYHGLYLMLPSLLLMCMAYLARRPDTFHLRLMILPIVVFLILRTYFSFVFAQPERSPSNWALGALAIVQASKAIDCACRPEGMLKVREKKPGVPEKSTHKGNGDAHPDKPVSSREKSSVWKHRLPAWLYDPIELLLASRGIGWQFGAGLHVPKEHRPLERSQFIAATLVSVLHSFLIIDACESFLKLVPGVGSPGGGTIFRPELAIPQRYILSTLVHLATGTFFAAGFEICYDLITIFAVGFFSSEPSSWPPVMDHPWKSDSLHVFWAKRWHQLLRETFFICGGFPGGTLCGNIGTVFGTFIGSGLYHEAGAYALGRGFDPLVMVFFALQAPLLVSERLWASATGHRVRGFYGRLWTYFCIIILGQPLVDSWHKRGLAGGIVIEPSLSPVRLLLIPFLQRSAELLGFQSLSASLIIG